ncbi:hypothetical protein B484DRAFT_164176, partial [Ochromonadaceae sp. CCMP2298]
MYSPDQLKSLSSSIMTTYEQFTDVCTSIHHHDHDRVASIAACHKGAGSGARYESMMYAVCAEERESASAPVVWKANFASSITPKTFQTLVLRVVGNAKILEAAPMPADNEGKGELGENAWFEYLLPALDARLAHPQVPKDQSEPGIPLSKAALNRAVFLL